MKSQDGQLKMQLVDGGWIKDLEEIFRKAAT